MSNGVVVFDYAAWQAAYPQFSTTVTTSGQAQSYFNLACLYLDNTACSPVRDATQRTTLLYLLTAHIAALQAGMNNNPASPLVGRIDQATEGTVTVHADMPAPMSAAWFMQTAFGASYWQATASLRTARYVPGPAGRPAPAPGQRGAAGFRNGYSGYLQ